MLIRQRSKGGLLMRRRLASCLPIAALALLVQLLAPIGAFRVVAQAASDPLAMAVVCTGIAAGDSGRELPSAPRSDGQCCAVCAASLGGSPVPDAQPLPVDEPRQQFQQLTWRPAIAGPPADRIGSNTQARAPPVLV
jgi:hypothetical protein